MYTIYNNITGEILYTLFGTGDLVTDNLQAHTYIAGNYDSQSYYIDLATQQAVSKGDRPKLTSVWNYSTQCWQDNPDQDAANARIQRNNLLKLVDSVNPIWYSTLTGQQQSELQAYRSALLAVPQQAEFPTTIEWPTKPVWL